MRRKMMGYMMAGLVSAGLAGAAWAADVPPQMTYQGRLKESGSLVTGPRSVEIWLCNLQTGGIDGTDCFSVSGPQGVSVQNGLFRSTYTLHSSVNLGTPPWYLEVRVGGTPLSPRETLTTVPYAFLASSATGITGDSLSIGVSTFVVKEGKVGIGTTSPVTGLHLHGDVGGSGDMTATRSGPNGWDSPVFSAQKSRGSKSAPTAVQNGDVLGIFNASGYDGTGYLQGGQVQFVVDGAPGANDMPGAIVFRTVPDNSITVTDRMIINNAGNVGIGLTNPTYQLQLSLDSAAKPTSNTWTIASDRRVKKDIELFTDGLEVVKKINPIRYRLNGKAGLPEGAEGISVVAQDVEDAIPYAISTYKAKLEPSDAQETDIYNFNSSPLTFVLINAVKELKAENEALKSRVLKLEGESR
ncbi:MAG: tail fiber domain-containing protein [Elusimicrobia bacterium]|nr:tail fiber domain-containing protein [Elusimicrobiota bacterium]